VCIQTQLRRRCDVYGKAGVEKTKMTVGGERKGAHIGGGAGGDGGGDGGGGGGQVDDNSVPTHVRTM
jgi:hypothetical protein